LQLLRLIQRVTLPECIIGGLGSTIAAANTRNFNSYVTV
jgi:hypothetical protein